MTRARGVHGRDHDVPEAVGRRAVGGTALYLTGLALLSVGIGAILRSTAAAISTVLALLWVPLIVISLIGLDDGLKLAKFSPMLAELAIQATVERADSVPINPWAGLGAMFAYAAVALAASAVARDPSRRLDLGPASDGRAAAARVT